MITRVALVSLIRDPVSPSAIQNDDFNFHFTIKTEWDWEDPPNFELGQWGIAELQEFADLIMPEGDPASGKAWEILDFFAENAYDPQSELLGIYTTVTNPDDKTTPPAGILDHFEIRLYDSASSAHAAHYWFECIIKNDPLNPIPGSGCTDEYMTPECVVRTWFAHEWQHVCHNYYTSRVHAWTDPALIGGGSYNEMTSKYSELLFGYGANAQANDLHYDLGLSRASTSFYYNCMCTWTEEEPEDCLRRHHYRELGLFAMYLQNNLSQGDIDFYPDWISEFLLTPLDSIYQRDFLSLSEWVDDPGHDDEYEDLLQGGYGNSDVASAIELFHKYSAAKFINLSDPNPEDQLFQWRDPNAELFPGLTPQNFYGLFQDWSGYWYNKVHVYPPYHVVGDEGVAIGPVVQTEDLWSDEWEEEMDPNNWPHTWYPALREYTRVVHLSSNAANYMVFLPEEGNEGTLQLSFFIEDLMPCIVADEFGENGGSIDFNTFDGVDDISFNIQLWGYTNLPGPVAPDDIGLDTYGDNAELIESRLYESVMPFDRLEFRIEDFGTSYDAVAVILSLTELYSIPTGGEPEFYESFAIPYRYSAHILPEQEVTLGPVIHLHTIVPRGSIVWVPWMVEVTLGATLEFEEGCQVYFTDDEAGIDVELGSLIVNGTEDAPVLFDVGAFSGSPPNSWEGISCNFVPSSDFAVHHADFVRLQGVSGNSIPGKIVEFTHCSFLFEFSPTMSGFLFPDNPADGPLQMDHLNFFDVDEVVISEAAVSNCSFFQLPSVFPPELPLLTFSDGDNYIENTVCKFNEIGVCVGSALASPTLEIGPGVELTQQDPGVLNHAIGFIVKNGAVAQTTPGIDEETLIISNTATGIEVQAGGSLTLRRANVDVEQYGLITWPDNGLVGSAYADLGTPEDPGFNSFRQFPDGGCIGEEDNEDNCLAVIDTEPPIVPIEVRVWNRFETSTLQAIGNRWDKCVCDESQGPPEGCPCAGEFFNGDVEWYPFIPIPGCCISPGGFFFGSSNVEVPFSLYPNPSNAQISIVFPYRSGEPLPRMTVYSLSGRKVVDLGVGEVLENSVSWVWDGRDSLGRLQASGIYFVQVRQAGRAFNKKAVVLK